MRSALLAAASVESHLFLKRSLSQIGARTLNVCLSLIRAASRRHSVLHCRVPLPRSTSRGAWRRHSVLHRVAVLQCCSVAVLQCEEDTLDSVSRVACRAIPTPLYSFLCTALPGPPLVFNHLLFCFFSLFVLQNSFCWTPLPPSLSQFPFFGTHDSSY